ncbi:unnamed protein product [Rotaria socialis]|uniref:Uncharacterized protein n=1 Tax=Rotaria socialis TaxID=392032 RepID=A0A818JAX0_9BILA|nr:unnamed protein product [Rotaria socialis]
MSSSTSTVQKKNQVTNTQRSQSENLPSGSPATTIKDPKKQVSGTVNKTVPIKNCHDFLKSIQHEYEQFEVNMDERD